MCEGEGGQGFISPKRAATRFTRPFGGRIPAAADKPPPGYYSYLIAFMEMSGDETGFPGLVNDFWNPSYTAILSWGIALQGAREIYPDVVFSALFDQTVNKTGSIATAFSNLTVL